jgi:acyl-coenzyme A synthetase/AMP-(fatty) acid ligase
MHQLRNVSLHNLYGPTETNVCTYYDVGTVPPEGDDPVPIGKAIDDVELVVVGEDGAPVAPGEVGELLVRGCTVMQGYFGDRERTSRALVPHPTRPDISDPCYRTGDLVRLQSDGNLEFLGRRDNQIKSRGYRIELGEVESALYSHERVTEAVVVAIADELIGNRLAAVVVGSDLTVEGVTRHCRTRLPHYMVPDDVLVVNELPKTSTGKVDRRAIAALCVSDKGESA